MIESASDRKWDAWRNAGELLGRIRTGLGFGDVTLSEDRSLDHAFIVAWSFQCRSKHYSRRYALTHRDLRDVVWLDSLAANIVNRLKLEAKAEIGKELEEMQEHE